MQNVVKELEDAINKSINIMDEHGCIIASSDLSRIGTYHDGAQEVIENHLDELIIEEDEKYSGSKNGINLPIIIQDEVVGVVGITGKKEEVHMLGKIIQKMTEILIVEQYKSNQKKEKESIRNNFVFNWLFSGDDDEAKEDLIFKGKFIGIDVTLPRIVVVISLGWEENENIENEEIMYKRIIAECTKALDKDPQNLVSRIGSKVILFIHNNDVVKVKKRIESIINDIEKQYKYPVYAGVGSLGYNKLNIKRSYREADTTCDLAKRMKNEKVKVYGDIDTEVLLESISKYEKDMFVKRVFKDCTKEEIDKWVTLLQCYFENNGSITKTAEDIYIHKNTVQYRLGKLKDISGYDVRNIKEAVPLYLAMLIYEVDKAEKL